MRRWMAGGAAALAAAALGAGAEAVEFEETSLAAGMAFFGPTWGASWGDPDGDGDPDLYLSNHYQAAPLLLLNQGDGRFVESGDVGFVWYGDQHGAAWGDADNDGRQDLIQLSGADSGTGAGANHLYLNRGGWFEERGADLGVDYPYGRGRSPLWLDWDGDGDLDVFLANSPRPDGQAPSVLLTQLSSGFVDDNAFVGISTIPGSNLFAQILRLGAEALPSLLIGGSSALRTDTVPFESDPERLGMPMIGQPWAIRDAAVADFDRDLQPDVYLARVRTLSAVEQVAAGEIHARVIANADEKAFEFRGGGAIRVALTPYGSTVVQSDGVPYTFSANDVHIGSSGWHPPCTVALPPECAFEVTASQALGDPPRSPGLEFGIYVSHDAAAGVWKIAHSSPRWKELSVVVEALDGSFASVAPVGFTSSDGEAADQLLVSTASGLVDATAGAGLDPSTACASVGAADFDNDMDVDLYLVCRGTVRNLPNRLLLNDGSGRFVPASGFGAEGSVAGRGDVVSLADYDGDGFIDLFVANGYGAWPFNHGPYQLFRNRGNANRSLSIHLQGVVSNRDGVGARVRVRAGGVTQLQEQDGGMHAASQDHARLHFGLGTNVRAQQVTVEWPSGAVQHAWNVSGKHVRAIEPSWPYPVGMPQDYQVGQREGVFLWQESGLYRLRVNGEGPRAEYRVRIVAAEPFQQLTPYSLESDDSFEGGARHLDLRSVVTSWDDGVDFRLPTGSTAVIAVERYGVPDPRRIHVGPQGLPLSPIGWILDADALPAPPSFVPGVDLGLFIGREPTTGEIVSRWNGDGPWHVMKITQLFSEPMTSLTPVSFEANDTIASGASSVAVRGVASTWWDGLDVTVAAGSSMALAYEQDGLIQPQWVNPNVGGLGPPNAYWLPVTQ